MLSFDPSHDLAGGDAQVLTERRARVSIGLLAGHDPPDGHRRDRCPALRELPAQPRQPRRLAAVLDGHRRRDASSSCRRSWRCGPSSRARPAHATTRTTPPGTRCSTPCAIARNGDDGTQWPHPPQRARRPRRRVRHRLRRARRRRSGARPRPPGHARQAPHVGPRRRPVRRGQATSRPSSAATTCAACRSNGAKAGNVNHALSIAKGEYFAIFDADFVPKEDFLVETLPFFVSERRRVRPDAAGVRQPPHRHRPRRRLHADRVLPVHPARPEPLQRRVLRRHQRGLPPRGRSTTSAACTPTQQVRGRVDLADAPRARLAQRLHPRRAGRRRRPRHHRGLHQAAAALGDRRVRDPPHPQPAQPSAPAHARPADHVLRHGDALPHRHHARCCCCSSRRWRSTSTSAR